MDSEKLKALKRITPLARWDFVERGSCLQLYYYPIPPQADNESLAEAGDRLILIHGTPNFPASVVRIAPKGELWSGWVIGLIA